MSMEICSLSMTEQPLWLFNEPAQTRHSGRLKWSKQNAAFELLMTLSRLHLGGCVPSHTYVSSLSCRAERFKRTARGFRGKHNSGNWSPRPGCLLPGIFWKQQGWWKTRGGYKRIASLNTFPCPAGCFVLDKQSELSRYKYKTIQKWVGVAAVLKIWELKVYIRTYFLSPLL